MQIYDAYDRCGYEGREQLKTDGDNNYNKLFPPFKPADLFGRRATT